MVCLLIFLLHITHALPLPRMRMCSLEHHTTSVGSKYVQSTLCAHVSSVELGKTEGNAPGGIAGMTQGGVQVPSGSDKSELPAAEAAPRRLQEQNTVHAKLAQPAATVRGGVCSGSQRLSGRGGACTACGGPGPRTVLVSGAHRSCRAAAAGHVRHSSSSSRRRPSGRSGRWGSLLHSVHTRTLLLCCVIATCNLIFIWLLN